MDNERLSGIESAMRILADGGDASLPPLTWPKELDNPATPPDVRARISQAHAGALMDRPHSTWTVKDRALIKAEISGVLRQMGR